ncbi:MazG nucleotide pyrophosphohydrolase domain-containing protein [Thermococcus sp.]|uniref:MazG nucleotide pyrophosphohydrolase domain-containing protein n=1 Tax=Thermococcus sp. TaxID=35749 RepID=UPI000F2BDB85|nr:MazG nucleotide pyrophosphohydrolase domain-containing protein [Thermococcus sp.]RLF73110.1 MAG: hypothetical protein DRN51_07410 [Thermococci archaeon]MCD6143990.1 hypothetical protein [Thermococcus sp.]RLF81712.1 MAG: hypothetical protein DRN38_01865 [Thermococci archaeon]RLF82552.1 MAG: hypothetical protein DRN48_08940 [Thermococci archaeon]RLF86551.1 MAG: hypothetical protein DRN41_02370 [Thermococci archaeon]
MKKLQEKVDTLIKEFGGYWEPFTMLAAVIEELGELSNEILKLEGIKTSKESPKVEEELGDVLFALFCIANYYNIDVEKALNKTILKYSSRDKERWNSSTP